MTDLTPPAVHLFAVSDLSHPSSTKPERDFPMITIASLYTQVWSTLSKLLLAFSLIKMYRLMLPRQSIVVRAMTGRRASDEWICI